MPKKKKTTKGELSEATKLDRVPRQFLPDISDDDLDAKQAAMSTRRRQGGPVLEEPDDDTTDDEELVARGFFRDPGVPPTELEPPQ